MRALLSIASGGPETLTMGELPEPVAGPGQVVVAVKAPAMREVAHQLGPLLGPDTVVLTAMNGVPWWFLQGFGGALRRLLAALEAEPKPAEPT